MARKKAEIERDWKKAETALDAAIAKCKSPRDYETFETCLTNLATPWSAWQKYLAESEKKISEKDWKDDKKLDDDRKKFKAWVNTQGSTEKPKYEKQVLAIQAKFAEWVAENREYDKQLKAEKARLLKAVADFKSDKDADEALETLEDINEKIGAVQMKQNVKTSVFNEGKGLLKAIAAVRPGIEKAQKEQLKVEGDVNKLTYDDIRKNMKLFKAFCQMVTRPELAKFYQATNYGQKGSEDAYKRYIKDNTVNVSASLIAEFEAVAAEDKPDWSKAPWPKVVAQIDGMLGNDPRHLTKFKEKLIELRSA